MPGWGRPLPSPGIARSSPEPARGGSPPLAGAASLRDTRRSAAPMHLPFDPPLAPMLSSAAENLPTGEGWLFEPKWDEFRAVVFRDGGEVLLQSRDEKPLNPYFPELLPPLAAGLPSRCVADGEIVIVGPQGLDFEALLLRIHPAASRVRLLAARSPASLVLWDLLALGEEDLRGRPLEERRQRLERRKRPLRRASVSRARAADGTGART